MVDRWIQADPSDPRPRTLKGIALAGLGRHEAAADEFARALAVAPDYMPALQGAAQSELQLGRPAARSRLDRIVELQPGNTVAHAMLGALEYAEANCPGALLHFSRGSEVVRADPSLLLQRAECSFEAGDFDSAASDFRLLIADGSAGPWVRHNLALALHRAGRDRDAAEVLEAAIDADRNPDVDTLSLAAEVQSAADDAEAAVQTLQRAIKLHPRAERLYIQLAELCLQYGSHELGLEVLGIAAANLGPSDRVLTMRGILLAELGRYEEAEAVIQEALSSGPGGQSTAVALSLTLDKAGRAEESLQVLRERVDEDPQDMVAQFLLAQGLIKRGLSPGDSDFRLAMEYLQNVVRQLPQEAAPLIELGKLHLQAGRLEEAVDSLRKAAELDPGERLATYNLMIALRRSGKMAEAAELASRIRAQLQRSKGDHLRRNRLRLVRGAPR